MLRNPPTNGTKSEVAASPLPSWGPTGGQKCYVTTSERRYCYVTLAFSGIPNKGDKIRGARFTPAFSGADKRGSTR